MPGSPGTEVGFAQQGSVDWVAFSNTVVPMSIGVLARLQGSGVQAITYAGIMQMANHFTLPPLGMQRLNEAISHLQVVNSASQLLYLGFGHRSLFRQLTESVSGLKVIAICSSLGETHGEEIASLVLAALWTELGYPEEFEPSYQQFRAIITCCNGTLVNTPYPLLVGNFLPLRLRVGNDNMKVCSEPQATAKALVALFDLVEKRKSKVVFSGGAECGFIAAVAHWFFDLDLTVKDAGGDQIFTTSKKADSLGYAPQVQIVYSAETSAASVSIVESTVTLPSTTSLFQTVTEGTPFIRWRVPWSSCLREAWPREFNTLKTLRTAVAMYLGSAARLAQLSREQRPRMFDMQAAYKHPNLSSHTMLSTGEAGYGLIHCIERTFPELAKFEMRQQMEALQEYSYDDAKTSYFQAFKSFEEYCQCYFCGLSSAGPPPSPQICLSDIACAILRVVLDLSTTTFRDEEVLRPDIHGLRGFAPARFKSSEHLSSVPWEFSNNSVEVKLGHLIRLFGKRSERICYMPNKRYNRLAGGSHDEFPLAISQEGICCFLDFILSPSTEQDDIVRIHVLCGQIEFSKSSHPQAPVHTYNRILDYGEEQGVHSFPYITSYEYGPDETLLENHIGAQPPVKMDITAQVIQRHSEEKTLRFRYLGQTPDGTVSIIPEQIIRLMQEVMLCYSCDDEPVEKPGILGKISQPRTTIQVVTCGWDVIRPIGCFYWKSAQISIGGELATMAVVGCSGLPQLWLKRDRSHAFGPCCVRAVDRIIQSDRHYDRIQVHII